MKILRPVQFSEEAEGIGTNNVPRFKVTWLDPRGGKATVAEVNADAGTIESLRFVHRATLGKPSPKVAVVPTPVPPSHPLHRINSLGQNFNPAYADELLPFIQKSVADWRNRLPIGIPENVTTNEIAQYYVSDQGGWPHSEITLTNGWFFVFRNSALTKAASPRRFFESDPIPFRIKPYAGEWRLSEKESVELARATVRHLQTDALKIQCDAEPRIFRPTSVPNIPTIPFLQIEWNYPSIDNRTQWIQVEVDCDRKMVISVNFDDRSLWGKSPSIDVPMKLNKRP